MVVPNFYRQGSTDYTDMFPRATKASVEFEDNLIIYVRANDLMEGKLIFRVTVKQVIF